MLDAWGPYCRLPPLGDSYHIVIVYPASAWEGDFGVPALRYQPSERASHSGASLSGDLDAPHMWSP